ncbi:MAG: IclR family transcriptional regulator [Spirochaetes bacterium]|nr:IclR family transcriptional regulator [Spirochaetota bacterium]
MPVPVLEKTIDILNYLLAHKEPLPLTDIHKSLKISKATAYNILETLAARGIVRKEEHRGGYTLGEGLAVYAHAVTSRSDHLAKIRALMVTAANELKETVKLSTLHDESAYVLDVVIPDEGYPVHSSPGRSFPLYAGGASKIILARLDESAFKSYVKRNIAEIERIFGSRDKFEQVINRVRKDGISIDEGEYETIIGAVAVDVTADEHMPLAVSCVFHRGLKSDTKINVIKACLKHIFQPLK